MLLDDLQLEEADSATERYNALSSIKEELTGAGDIIDCRLDLIEKVNGSSVGWPAAAFYEKTNGLVLTAESGKHWANAEKSAREAKKKPDKMPFRSGPGSSGKYSDSQFSRQRGWLFSLRAF